MSKILTILYVFAGVSSILGISYVIATDKTKTFRRIAGAAFLLAGVLSAYILLMPSSWLEENVKAKIRYYEYSYDEKPSGKILIQRSEFSYKGNHSAIEFPLYYKTPPKIEIINIEGHEEGWIPKVQKITEHQVTLYRSTTGGFAGERFHKYIWVARGEPLEPINLKK